MLSAHNCSQCLQSLSEPREDSTSTTYVHSQALLLANGAGRISSSFLLLLVDTLLSDFGHIIGFLPRCLFTGWPFINATTDILVLDVLVLTISYPDNPIKFRCQVVTPTPKPLPLSTHVISHPLSKDIGVIFQSGRVVGSVDTEVYEDERYGVEAGEDAEKYAGVLANAKGDGKRDNSIGPKIPERGPRHAQLSAFIREYLCAIQERYSTGTWRIERSKHYDEEYDQSLPRCAGFRTIWDKKHH